MVSQDKINRTGRSRRTFLKAAGASGLATMTGLAGCSGDGGDGGSGDGGDGGDGGGDGGDGGDGGSTGTPGGDDTVLVGGIVPLSGPLGQLGESEERGLEVAVEHINSELGGMAGRDVELLVEDTATDPETGQEGARRLVEQDEVDVLAGAVSGAVAHSIAQYAYSQRVPFWTYGGAKQTTGEECTPTVFRIASKTTQDARAGAPWSVEEFGSNVWIHYAEYAYGQSIREDWQSEVEGADGNVVDVTSTPLGESDFSSYISQMQASDADWILMGLTGSDLISFVNQAEQFGLKDEKDLVSQNVTTQPIRQGMGEAGIGVYGNVRYDQNYDSPQNETLTEVYSAAHGQPPDDSSMVMWESLMFHAEAANAVDSVATEDVVPEIEGMERDTSMGPMTIRECDHQAIRDIPMGRITEPDEHDWPGLEILDTIPGDEAIEPCEETGCDMPSL